MFTVAAPLLMLSTLAQTPSYSAQVRPFLAKYCLECHNAKSQKAGLDLESHKAILAGSDNGPAIVPGKADESPLVLLTEGKEKPVMPPKNAKFQPTKAEIAILRAWVSAGAKDDAGKIAITIPKIVPRKLVPDPIVALGSHHGTLYFASGLTLSHVGKSTGKLLARSSGEGERITALAIAGDQLVLAHGKPGEEGWLDLPAVHKTWRSGQKDAVLDLAVSRDGTILAAANYDTTIKLWSLPEAKELFSLREHSDAVHAVAFSPNGKLLASAGADRAVKVWDTATGKLLYTLGDANDWLYALAFSPDGQWLAAGGADKSIRVYRADIVPAKLAQSVFAHEGPVHKLLYDADGKTLYSLGQDRVAKAWDPGKMTERTLFERQPETVLSMALLPEKNLLALGRHDGVVSLLDIATGKAVDRITSALPRTGQVDNLPIHLVGLTKEEPEKVLLEKEPNNSPGTGMKILLPTKVRGVVEKAGATDYYRFEADAGYQLGVKISIKEGVKLDPFLMLLDAKGQLLAQSTTGLLGFTIAEKGTYSLGVRDRDYRGGIDLAYDIDLGTLPVITAIYPLGGQLGATSEVHLEGVNLGLSKPSLKLAVPKDAKVGTKIAVPIKALNSREFLVGEYPEVFAEKDDAVPVPGTANGKLPTPGSIFDWKFQAKKGEPLIVETHARRLGSPLDTSIEILNEHGQSVPRALLRCQAKTYVTFRDHDSAVAGIRIEAWNDLATNDLIYAGDELMKIRALPTHPDADCNFFAEAGQRLGYFDTTPTHHSNGTPLYKVSVHRPGTAFPPNGFPIFTLYYRNDDGGPGYGRDSKVLFDPPTDGPYQVRLRDARGQGGSDFIYRLTVRPPRPDFTVTMSPAAPQIPRGSGLPVTITAQRLDGFQGEIFVRLENLPEGIEAPPTSILAGETNTAVSLFARDNFKDAIKPMPLRVVAHAMIDGKKVTHDFIGSGPPTVIDTGDLTAHTEESTVSLKPGGQTKLTVAIDRHNGFLGRVPLDVRGLPHGVRVLDIGLNGILITERETRRTIVLYAEPWVEPTDHPFVVLARREGKNTEHAAKTMVLRIAR